MTRRYVYGREQNGSRAQSRIGEMEYCDICPGFVDRENFRNELLKLVPTLDRERVPHDRMVPEVP